MTIDMTEFETITIKCDIPACTEEAEFGGSYDCGHNPPFLLCGSCETGLYDMVADGELTCATCGEPSHYAVHDLTDDN